MSQAALNALLTYQANQENAKNQRYNELWDSYMNQFGSGGEGYQNLLNQRNAGLDSAFNDYYGATAANTNEYTGGLSSLMDKLNSPSSQITFGLQGSDPVSFTNKSVRNDVSTLASLMADKANASNNLASSKYNYATNKANSILDFYNELKNTAAAAKSGDISNLIGTYGSNQKSNQDEIKKILDNIKLGEDVVTGGLGGSSDQGGSVGSIMSLLKTMGIIGAGA